VDVVVEWTMTVINIYQVTCEIEMTTVLPVASPYLLMAVLHCLLIHFFSPDNCIAGIGSPYRAASNYGARFISSSSPNKTNMNEFSQRIMSAKLLRVKQLQNELTDAQFQLNVSIFTFQ
jgi:hypothetical protein